MAADDRQAGRAGPEGRREAQPCWIPPRYDGRPIQQIQTNQSKLNHTEPAAPYLRRLIYHHYIKLQPVQLALAHACQCGAHHLGERGSEAGKPAVKRQPAAPPRRYRPQRTPCGGGAPGRPQPPLTCAPRSTSSTAFSWRLRSSLPSWRSSERTARRSSRSLRLTVQWMCVRGGVCACVCVCMVWLLAAVRRAGDARRSRQAAPQAGLSAARSFHPRTSQPLYALAHSSAAAQLRAA